MKTKIYKSLQKDDIEEIGKLLRCGEVIAIPTETVYGLGANGLKAEALAKIYEAKGRPSDNPLILHVSCSEEVVPLVKNVSKTAQRLMDAFWPGPLTITMPKSDNVPMKATGGLNTVAIRCPNHDICRQIIKAAGVPIAAPSANISGRPSPTTLSDVINDMDGKIAGIVDGGECKVGIESTVVEVGDNEVTILRPGAITEELLLTVVDKVHWDKAILGENVAPKAPGMKYKHYAPNAEMYTYVGEIELVSKAIEKDLINNKNKRFAIITSDETIKAIEENLVGVEHAYYYKLTYGSKNDLTSLAHNLYSLLLRCNELEIDTIIAEGVDNKGLGAAIMNRLNKASNHNIINL